MSRFLRTLARVGLVELDTGEAHPPEQVGLDEAQATPLVVEETAFAQDAASAPELPDFARAPEGALRQEQAGHPRTGESTSFESLYRSAQLPSSPFPAEKLLKLLDGLRAMDPATRKAAVTAMDAADDAWTIDDALLDAERKTRALGQGVERLQANLLHAEELAQKELASLADYAQKATDTIRKQIAELEGLLQQELEVSAQKKAQAQADLRLAREACAREQARYEQEIVRLSEVASIFGSPAAKPPTPKPSAG